MAQLTVLYFCKNAPGEAPIADRFANGFDDPTDFENWFLDPRKAESYLTTVAQAA